MWFKNGRECVDQLFTLEMIDKKFPEKEKDEISFFLVLKKNMIKCKERS